MTTFLRIPGPLSAALWVLAMSCKPGPPASTSESPSQTEARGSTSPPVRDVAGDSVDAVMRARPVLELHERVDDAMRAAPVIALAEFDASCPTDCRGGVTQLVVVRALETVRGHFRGCAANFADWYVCPSRFGPDAKVLVVGIVPEETLVQHPDACWPDQPDPIPVQGYLSALKVFPGLEEARRYANQISAGVD